MLDIDDCVRANLINYLAASIEADGKLASALGFTIVAGTLESAASTLSRLDTAIKSPTGPVLHVVASPELPIR